MDTITGTSKRILSSKFKQVLTLLALTILLEIGGAPTKSCYLGQYMNLIAKEAAPRALRNKYEELRFEEVEPWHNCSGKDLRPKWKLGGLKKREMLEAVQMQVSLAIRVLQNQSEPALAKDASQVVDILRPLQDDLLLCMQQKPSRRKPSRLFRAFQKQLQKFETSNAMQSPQCLEAAVGMNIVQLFFEVHQVSRDYSHHHHYSSN